MLHFIVTAGGTVEDIDEVRKITNTSTGQLGICLAEEIIKYMEQAGEQEYQIHYIVTATAIKPDLFNEEMDHVTLYEVTDTKSVLNTINELFDRYTIDYFIHSMAVSDFTANHMIPMKKLAEEIKLKLESTDKEQWLEAIEHTLKNPKAIMDRSRKISSDDDMILALKKTTKIISLLKGKNKELFLVGFKLLKNVSEEELIRTANLLAEKNECDLMLANDLESINQGIHQGILIKNKEVLGKYEGKRNIAKAIVYQMLKNR